jgi:hypothetical protein
MRRTLDRRAAVLRELDESGLSMAEFCRQRRLVYGTVAAWRSELRRQRAGFVEVEIADSDGSSPVTNARHGTLCAELLLPGGMVLRVFGRHAGGVAQEEQV